MDTQLSNRGDNSEISYVSEFTQMYSIFSEVCIERACGVLIYKLDVSQARDVGQLLRTDRMKDSKKGENKGIDDYATLHFPRVLEFRKLSTQFR